MKTRWLIAALLAVVLMTPLAMNSKGISAYLYLHLGFKDLVLGSAFGNVHMAVGDPINSTIGASGSIAGLTWSSHTLGPIEVILESYERFEISFHFTGHTDPEYTSFDFPLPLLLIIPLGIALIPTKQREDRAP